MDSKALQQTERFQTELPKLIERFGGRWVVYLDGVQTAHDSEDEAFAEAIRRYGPNGGFIVAQVVDAKPTPITASIAYGFA